VTFGDDKLVALGGVTIGVAGFVARWVWERVWRKTDAQKEAEAKAKAATEKARDDRVNALDGQVAAVIRRQDVAEAKEAERARALGVLETNQNRLDGKVDGLQKHWTSRFDKLDDDVRAGFRAFDEKLEYKLDNLRMELRGDNQKLEERIVKLFGDHQQRIHNRLNEATAAYASSMTELVDRLVDRAGEPRPSPQAPPATTPPYPTQP
jgi:chromosome segregation ATPase